MLARYAAKCGEDTAVDADAILGEYEDASTVSEWAEGDVAYLVSTGVMGSDSPLRGADPITRAEVATMVVRLDDVFDFTFNAFCIPVALFRGTATNIQDVVAHWLTVCIDPLAAMLGEEITRKRYGLAGWRRGSYVLVDTSTLQHFDIFANASNIEKLVGSGAFSINDVLAAAGRAEIDEDWARSHWLTLNITRIENAAQAAETAGKEPNSA